MRRWSKRTCRCHHIATRRGSKNDTSSRGDSALRSGIVFISCISAFYGQQQTNNATNTLSVQWKYTCHAASPCERCTPAYQSLLTVHAFETCSISTRLRFFFIAFTVRPHLSAASHSTPNANISARSTHKLPKSAHHATKTNNQYIPPPCNPHNQAPNGPSAGTRRMPVP